MLFNLTDVILLVLIASFGVIGFAFGLIRVIGALVGLVLGSWVASVYYLSFAVWINEHLWNFSSATKIIAFILLFGIANRVITFGFYIIGKFFNLLSIIPFLGMINRITGAILGLLEGILVLGLVVYVSFKFSQDITWIFSQINDSKIAMWLVWLTDRVAATFPLLYSKIN